MRKLLYFLFLAIGFGIFVYFYIINFNNMSEGDLVTYATAWYIPLIFGLYGLYAVHIQEKAGPEDTNALKFIFSGKDSGLLVITIGLAGISGVFGAIFFIIPLALIKPQFRFFPLFTALIATVFWVVLLAFFLLLIFPSL